MTGRDEELDGFKRVASGLLAQLDAGQRSRLLRRMALDLRRSQARRIASQRAPDGSSWPPRKPRRDQDRVISRPLRFLYRKPNGDVRVADMRSWRPDGPMITGYDREAGGLRSFLKSRMERHLPPEGGGDPGAMEGSIRGRRGGVRRRARAMFGKLKGPAHLKSGADPSSAWVEFTRRASRIARIHHYGLRDRVVPGGPETDYPARELLGFSQADDEAMLASLLRHMDEGL